MFRLLGFIFAVFCFAQNVFCQTISSPTVWRKSQSPIILTRTLDIRSTLTIEAGVEVRMPVQGRISFWHGQQAKLIVNGTEAEPVVFRSSTGSPWNGLNLPSPWATRPLIQCSHTMFLDLGGTSTTLSLQTAEVDFFKCRFVSLGPTIPAGYPSAGSPVFVGGGGVGLFEQCSFLNFGRGFAVNTGMALIDCQFDNIIDAVRIPAGKTVQVSALGL